MKALMVNGSPHTKGNTYRTLLEIGKQLEKENIQYEIFQIGAAPVQDCIGCEKCAGQGCVIKNDKVAEFVSMANDADGFIFGTPVYYAHPSGRIQSFLDRAFHSTFLTGNKPFAFKPAAAVAIARRGGTSASLDVLNKYFGIAQMPIVGSTYWNMVHGFMQGEVELDAEGMQTMRNLARNMAWILKCLEKGKEAGIEFPKTEHGNITNFIRS